MGPRHLKEIVFLRDHIGRLGDETARHRLEKQTESSLSETVRASGRFPRTVEVVPTPDNKESGRDCRLSPCTSSGRVSYTAEVEPRSSNEERGIDNRGTPCTSFHTAAGPEKPKQIAVMT